MSNEQKDKQDKVNYAVSEREDRETGATTLTRMTGYICAVLSCTGLYWNVLGFTGLYWALLENWTCLGFNWLGWSLVRWFRWSSDPGGPGGPVGQNDQRRWYAFRKYMVFMV